MRIIHVSAEMAPLAKVGGMADVLLGLARAQRAKGHDVTVILPKYECIKGLKKETNKVWRKEVEGIPLICLGLEHPIEHIYGGPGEIKRFLAFNKAAYNYIKSWDIPPDIIHLHDWHTAAMTAFCKKSEFKTVFTIHNLAYQGQFPLTELSSFDLPKTPFKDPSDKNLANLLKGAILLSDAITTVSPTYANEILTKPFGGHLASILRKHKNKLSGILNGIDYTYWDPKKDPFLPHNFSLKERHKKQKVKEHLQRRLHLKPSNAPLMATICRLVPQKGPELIAAAIEKALSLGGQFVLLGSICDDETQKQFLALQKKYKTSKQIHIELSYNEPLSHLVYAASDLFIVPSHFEPCGLTQLIAMRYGALPIVRRTGGLADTVSEENGFLFTAASKEATERAVAKAFATWKKRPKEWASRQKRAAEQNSSWDKPADSYLKLYTKIK